MDPAAQAMRQLWWGHDSEAAFDDEDEDEGTDCGKTKKRTAQHSTGGAPPAKAVKVSRRASSGSIQPPPARTGGGGGGLSKPHLTGEAVVLSVKKDILELQEKMQLLKSQHGIAKTVPAVFEKHIDKMKKGKASCADAGASRLLQPPKGIAFR